jgi:hypothetical protein
MDRFRRRGGVDRADRLVDQLVLDPWRSLLASLE